MKFLLISQYFMFWLLFQMSVIQSYIYICLAYMGEYLLGGGVICPVRYRDLEFGNTLLM